MNNNAHSLKVKAQIVKTSHLRHLFLSSCQLDSLWQCTTASLHYVIGPSVCWSPTRSITSIKVQQSKMIA